LLPKIGLTLGVLAALAAGAPPPQAAAPAAATTRAVVEFPAPAHPLVVPAEVDGGKLTLARLVDLYATATDQVVLYDEQTAQVLEHTALSLTGPITVPHAREQHVFETLLSNNQVLLNVLSEEPRILSVVSLQTSARTSIREHARFVPSARIEDVRAHPAMIFTTVVDLPRVDVRQLANSMRTLISDANTQQMLPAGNSNSMVLTGTGGQLAAVVEMLHAVHDAAPEPQPEPVRLMPVETAPAAPEGDGAR
jgi:hypothetical protein